MGNVMKLQASLFLSNYDKNKEYGYKGKKRGKIRKQIRRN